MRLCAFISFSMFGGLIDGAVAQVISENFSESEITEIRFRVGRPLVVFTSTGGKRVKFNGGKFYTVTTRDIDRILAYASDFSVYAVNDQLVKGYLSKGGVRIGVCGEGVAERGEMMTLKNIGYLVVRVPHEIKGAADKVLHAVNKDCPKSTLIISPPGAGKTTLLRDMARQFSAHYNVLIIDERGELAASSKGIPLLDVGDCEVVSGVAKTVAYENSVRAMSPDIIVTDELFRLEEVRAVCDMTRCGVKVFASVHGGNEESVRRSEIFAPLFEVMETIVTLGKNPVGKLTNLTTRD